MKLVGSAADDRAGAARLGSADALVNQRRGASRLASPSRFIP